MTLKKYILGFVFSLTSAIAVQAQDILPEALPSHPKAERIVKEVSAVTEPTTATVTTESKPSFNASFGESVVNTALQYLGARYRAGMSGPTAFDCSGFTSYVYGLSNVSLLRSSRSQFTQGTPISQISDLKKGDLVFFGGSGRSRTVGHVGIVTDVDPSGNNFSFVHASRTGIVVSESNEPYYSRRYMGARRIVENESDLSK